MYILRMFCERCFTFLPTVGQNSEYYKFTFNKIIQKDCDLYKGISEYKKNFLFNLQFLCHFCQDFDAIRTNRSSVYPMMYVTYL